MDVVPAHPAWRMTGASVQAATVLDRPLDRLADPEFLARDLPSWAAPGEDDTAAVLALWHRTIAAVVATLVVPFAVDGAGVLVRASELGLDAPEVTSPHIFIARHDVEADADARAVGARVAALAMPVAAALCAAKAAAMRWFAASARDQLRDAYLVGRRHARASADPGVETTLCAALGGVRPRFARAHTARVGAGHPLAVPAREVCCVRARTATDQACPNCPIRPDDAEREREVAAWVNGLDDTEFLRVVGRPRAARIG